MNAHTQSVIGLGHNGPPLKDLLETSYADMMTNVAEAVASAGRAPEVIADDETLGKFGDLVKILTRLAGDADKAREAEKKPFLSAGRDVDDFFRPIAASIADAKKMLLGRQTAYLTKKEADERRRQEQIARDAAAEAERALEGAASMQDEGLLATAVDAEARAEQASAMAVAKPAELVRTHSTGGSVSTLKKEWTFAVDDYAAVPLEMLRPYFAAEVIDKAVRAAVKAGVRQIPGVRIFEAPKAMVR